MKTPEEDAALKEQAKEITARITPLRKELKVALRIVNKLIERIEVHNNDKSSGHCYVKVDIYFTGVGMISIPSEEELLAMMEDIRKNPEEYRLAA